MEDTFKPQPFSLMVTISQEEGGRPQRNDAFFADPFAREISHFVRPHTWGRGDELIPEQKGGEKDEETKWIETR